jgi:hypothetical protein
VKNSFKAALSAISGEKTYRVTLTDEGRSQTVRDISGAELSEGILLETRGPRESAVLEYRAL